MSASLIFANESFATTLTQRFYEADVRWSGVSDLSIETRNAVGKKAGKPGCGWIAGVVLLAACLVAPRFLPASFPGMIMASSPAILALVGLVPLVPFLTRLIARLIANHSALPQDVVLGVRNIQDNPSLMNNIQLFSAAIAIVAFMASIPRW